MSRENIVRVRLSDIELQALKRYAESIGVPMSEVLRDHVKTLIGKEVNTLATPHISPLP